MRLHYVAPSILPSRSANSVHVVWQCDGLARLGAEVTLYAKRAMMDSRDLPQALEAAYGIRSESLRLETIYAHSRRGENLRIAHHAVRCIQRGGLSDVILSRNLYAAFAMAVVYRVPLLFETHQLEVGCRKWMQKQIIRCPWVTTILISNNLAAHLRQYMGVSPYRTLVLQDAAPEGITPVHPGERRAQLGALVQIANSPWKFVCGYFGHLYAGRGIELVEAMAQARPDILFLVYGGTESDLKARRDANRAYNLAFMGHVSHPAARKLMCLMDALLMPYQERVSIGVAGHDTARWMSPMKMFEYLGSGVPIISSDLPVLREVLRDGENCLLVPAADVGAWTGAIKKLENQPDMASRIGSVAHIQYAKHHTWTSRARQLLAAAEKL